MSDVTQDMPKYDNKIKSYNEDREWQHNTQPCKNEKLRKFKLKQSIKDKNVWNWTVNLTKTLKRCKS